MAHLYSRRNSAEYRDKLTGEHKYGDLGQAIIACLFFALWISDGSLEYSTFLNQYISNSIRVPIGIILFGVGCQK
jgi:uncharacterized membrane protein YczE